MTPKELSIVMIVVGAVGLVVRRWQLRRRARREDPDG